MEDKLVDWLNTHVEDAGSIRALARKADLSHTTVAEVLSGARSPTYEFCAAIADAVHEPRDKVFRLAGLLPPSRDGDERRDEILFYYDRMIARDRERFRVIGRALAEASESYGDEATDSASGSALAPT